MTLPRLNWNTFENTPVMTVENKRKTIGIYCIELHINECGSFTHQNALNNPIDNEILIRLASSVNWNGEKWS